MVNLLNLELQQMVILFSMSLPRNTMDTMVVLAFTASFPERKDLHRSKVTRLVQMLTEPSKQKKQL